MCSPWVESHLSTKDKEKISDFLSHRGKNEDMASQCSHVWIALKVSTQKPINDLQHEAPLFPKTLERIFWV